MNGLRRMINADQSGSKTEEFAEPTPQSRRRFVIQSVLIILAFLFAVWFGKLWFAFLKSLPACEDLPYIRAMLVAWVVVPSVIGVYGVWVGRRLLVHQQWPPPGRALFKRQRISRGRAVRWRAYWLLAISALSLATPIWGGYLLSLSGIFSPPVAGSRCALASSVGSDLSKPATATNEGVRSE